MPEKSEYSSPDHDDATLNDHVSIDRLPSEYFIFVIKFEFCAS